MTGVHRVVALAIPDVVAFDLSIGAQVFGHKDEQARYSFTGSGLMADDELRAGFVARGFDDRELRDTAVIDPATTVTHDVRLILDAPNISERIAVSGISYDVHTGRLTAVPTPTREGVRS